MSNFHSRKLEGKPTWMRFIPYAALGVLIFSFNSSGEMNYFLRGYLVLLEAQIGIVLIYFIMSKLAKKHKS
ncbi:hypothetical protein BCD67_20220 [Oscillatoriales cyanobacterium USR001]|nr:hypothetical protein BCD67_20220 [Oscillatoriales cyanobacterium USR001]